MAALVKAFILCDNAQQQPAGDKSDLTGAGFSHLSPTQSVVSAAQPFKHPLYIYVQLVDDKPEGRVRLALTRADSGRQFFFREIVINFQNGVTPAVTIVRMLGEFPDKGVYFVELWYDDEWQIDQRLEIL
jgi:hypothetical protein